MAATEELRLLLKTVADTSGLTTTEKALKGVESSAGTSASSLLKFGAAAGIAGLATDKFVGFLGDSLQVARDHDRITRALTASYGAQTMQWTRFATQLSATTGFTSDAILEAALSARTLSQNYGRSTEETQKLIKASADLARIRGIGIEQAFERVQGAIRGEAEASEYLGLTLGDTFMKTTAMNGALKDTWGTLSETEKARARYLEFLRQAADFSGLASDATGNLDIAFGKAANSANRLQLEIGEMTKPAVLVGLRAVADTLDLIREGGFIGRGITAVQEAARGSTGGGGGSGGFLGGAAAAGSPYLDPAVKAAYEQEQARRERDARRMREINELPTRSAAADMARLAYLDQLDSATRELTDAYREQNRIERESIQLSAQLAAAQLAALPATERLQDVQTQIQRDRLLLGLRGQISPEQRQAARLDIRNLTRNVLPGAELAALNAEVSGRPVERALARNRLLGTVGAGVTGAAEGRVEHIVSGTLYISGDLATAVLSDDQKAQIGQEIVGMFHKARVAAENSASTRLAGA